MKIERHLADGVILAELGGRLRERRISLGLSQDQLAEESGVDRKVVSRLENGEEVRTGGLIRVLRVLDLLGELDGLVPSTDLTPLEIADRKPKRQRVRRAAKTGEEWSWGDE